MNRFQTRISDIFVYLREFSRVFALRGCEWGIQRLVDIAGALARARPASPYQDRYSRNSGVRD